MTPPPLALFRKFIQFGSATLPWWKFVRSLYCISRQSLLQWLLFYKTKRDCPFFRVHLFNHYLRIAHLLVQGSEWWLWSILKCLELFNRLYASLTFSILIDNLHLRNFSPPMRKFRKVDSNIAFSFIDIVDCSDAVVVDTITPPIVGPRNRGSHSNPIASLDACRVVLFAWLN